ncbi:MAG: hypothetical protein ACAH09_09440 [Methylophilaceae bacterium]|jgi:hypothetical protein|nr:hypothetical protein [Methylophilaceae bacterium]
MGNYSLRYIQLRYWLKSWWQFIKQDSLAPLLDSSARLNFISVFALLIFILPPEGYVAWRGELTNTIRALNAFLYSLPIFIIVNSICSIFKTIKHQERLGIWVGNRFVFHEPIHLKTLLVTSDNNDTPISFTVSEFPTREASVDLIAKIENGFDDRNVRVQFLGRADQPIIWDQYERHNILAFVPENNTFYIATNKPLPSNPTTVKIYLMSWYAPN